MLLRRGSGFLRHGPYLLSLSVDRQNTQGLGDEFTDVGDPPPAEFARALRLLDRHLTRLSHTHEEQ